jgi:hypothetical protein
MSLALAATALSGVVSIAGGQAAAAPTSGYRAEFLKEVNYFDGRFTQLAEAIPAEKYNWRPGEGVRSVAEVLLHVAQRIRGCRISRESSPPLASADRDTRSPRPTRRA